MYNVQLQFVFLPLVSIPYYILLFIHKITKLKKINKSLCSMDISNKFQLPDIEFHTLLKGILRF